MHLLDWSHFVGSDSSFSIADILEHMSLLRRQLDELVKESLYIRKLRISNLDTNHIAQLISLNALYFEKEAAEKEVEESSIAKS